MPTKAAAKKPSKSDNSALDIELFGEAWKLLKDQFYGDLPQGKAHL